VNGRALGVIVVAGLAVVGFAIFYIGAGRGSDRRAATQKAAAAQPDKPPPRKPTVERPTSKAPASAPTREAKQAVPETLEDARAAYDSYIAELDREIERLEQSGGRLTEEAFMQYRTRAVGAIDGVLRRLDHTDPREMAEIQDKQRAVKERLDKLQPE
jgi:hypothetical protein